MTTLETVNRFNEAFNRQDLDAVMDTFSDDCVFDNSTPRPDGERFVGQAAVRAFWEEWFAGNPDAKFESEEMIVSGDRCTVRWVYRKTRDGQPWHLRGVDVFRVRDGQITEKLVYVKG